MVRAVGGVAEAVDVMMTSMTEAPGAVVAVPVDVERPAPVAVAPGAEVPLAFSRWTGILSSETWPLSVAMVVQVGMAARAAKVKKVELRAVAVILRKIQRPANQVAPEPTVATVAVGVVAPGASASEGFISAVLLPWKAPAIHLPAVRAVGPVRAGIRRPTRPPVTAMATTVLMAQVARWTM